MRNYEIMFIVNPNATEEEIDKINGQVESIVTSGGGKIEKIEKMGKRRLAYDVDKHREGFYVLFVISAQRRHHQGMRTPSPRHGCCHQIHYSPHRRRRSAGLKKCAVIGRRRAARRGSGAERRAGRICRRGHAMKSAKEKRPAGQKQYYRRKKVCKFCVERIDTINYKDVKLLSQFVPERAKIMPRRISGVCSHHQRLLNDAIKKARNIALLPFATE